MKFLSLGGINEHGRNCFLLQGKNHQVLLDCGLGEEGEYPDFSLIDVRKIDALFLSHSHLDHVGALKKLVSLGFKGKVYLSKETYDCMSYHDFEHEFLFPCGVFSLYPWLRVKTFRSGHCFGSLCFLFEMEDKKVVYTGDYLEDSIFVCDSLRDMEADLAIIDGAYQDDENDMPLNKEKLIELIVKQKKVILPLPKNGRSAEVISLLSEHGISYQLLSSFFREEEGIYLRKPIPIKSDSNSDVLLMDDPQLSKMESRRIVDEYKNHTLIFTGTIDEGSYAMELMKNRKNTYFQRLNVHQRMKDAKRLASLNHFMNVICFHNGHTSEKMELEF